MSEDIYREAIIKWGLESQTEMLIEECSEVILSVQKFKRALASNNPDRVFETTNNVHEELADLTIMLEQMMIVFDAAEINKIKSQKIERLKKRIDSV